MPDEPKIDALLQRWNSDFTPDPLLVSRVKAQVRSAAARNRAGQPVPFLQWCAAALSRPGLAAGFAGLFLLAGFGLSQVFLQGRGAAAEELKATYRLSIDPLYRLQAIAGARERDGGRLGLGADHPPGEDAQVMVAGLGWLQGALDLSPPQYRRVSALHSDYERAFDELFLDLLESYRAYREFDRARMSNDVIDYVQFYELLQTQKRLSEESALLTEELLGKVAAIIEPDQRERYREMLSKMYPDFGLRSEALGDA